MVPGLLCLHTARLRVVTGPVWAFPKRYQSQISSKKRKEGEEYSYVFQGLIQQLKASMDFSWMLAPALHKRKEI